MKGSANYQKSNMDDDEKEVIVLYYYVKECGSVKAAEKIKLQFDKIVEDAGGETTLPTSSKE